MKSESGINNRWNLLERATGILGIKYKFNAYGWFENDDLKIKKDEHWCGWWNDCFRFIDVWTKTKHGQEQAEAIKNLFIENGYRINDGLINGGFSIHYDTMTKEESDRKAQRNLENGGRMSD